MKRLVILFEKLLVAKGNYKKANVNRIAALPTPFFGWAVAFVAK